MEQKITSLASFFETFSQLVSVHSATDVYRGHADRAYKLMPSLFRQGEGRKNEKNIFRELLCLHPTEFSEDRSVFEQLVRMQHFSMPTRLLDVTYNPLVALYFACKGADRKDGEFIRLRIPKKKVRYFDSDTVSCIANLSNLTSKERNELRSISDQNILQGSHAGKRLLQFIRAEKPYFLPEIRPADLKSIQVVKPKQNNRRILAQQGAFLIFGLCNELVNANDFDIKISRTIIPAGYKQNIFRDLDRVNINASSLFPEIESAARYIMAKLTPVE